MFNSVKFNYVLSRDNTVVVSVVRAFTGSTKHDTRSYVFLYTLTLLYQMQLIKLQVLASSGDESELFDLSNTQRSH